MLINFLQRLAMGEFDRGMVFMPPGYAKTEYVSVLFPPWFMCLYPDEPVIAASNTADLAIKQGRRVRNLIAEYAEDLGYDLSMDNKSAGDWGTNTGGEYFAVGVSGTVIGRRAALAIVDDPIRSRAEVESQAMRDNLWDWYHSSLQSRMKPFGKMLIMHTRWHNDDLAGRGIKHMESGEGERFEILKLPAIAMENDPMGRKPGQALWPKWQDEKKLAALKASIGPREWASQYQQDPIITEGALFAVERLDIQPALPPGVTTVEKRRAWDLAATEQTGGKNPDWTVGVLCAKLSDGRFAVLDVQRMRGTPMAVERKIMETARVDGYEVAVELPQDPGQAGKSQINYLVRSLMGYIVHYSPETGSKETRAMPLASQIEAGNVFVLKRSWTDEYVAELMQFPAGEKDDQVDATSRGFNSMVQIHDGTEIIRYYEEKAKIASNEKRPVANDDNEWTQAYNEAAGAIGPGLDIKCKTCNVSITGARVSDGVDSWHPGCFHK